MNNPLAHDLALKKTVHAPLEQKPIYAWRDVLAYDSFGGAIVTTRPPPWDEYSEAATTECGDLVDEDVTRVCAWLSHHYDLDVSAGFA